MVREESNMLGGIGNLINSCSLAFGDGFLFKTMILPQNEISVKSFQFAFSLASRVKSELQ